MKLWLPLVLLFGLSLPAFAQKPALPNAPDSQYVARTYSLSANLTERYSFAKGTYSTVPGIAIDRRFFDTSLRISLGYSHIIETGDNNVSVTASYKFLVWGKRNTKKNE